MGCRGGLAASDGPWGVIRGGFVALVELSGPVGVGVHVAFLLQFYNSC